MKAITANFIMACASDKNGFHSRHTPARVAMQLDRVRPIRAGRSRIRLGSETDLDEQIVSGAFRERQNSAPHPDNPRSVCQHTMPHVRDTGRYGAFVAQVGLRPRNLLNLHPVVVLTVADSEATASRKQSGKGIPLRDYLVAVGTTIAGRPPRRSVRALTSAYGSYLG